MTYRSPGHSDPSPRPRPLPRLVAAVSEAFIGVGALFGGYGLIADAEGLGLSEAWLSGSPFTDYTVPGFFLLIVLGGGLLAAAAFTIAGNRWWPLLAMLGGWVLAWWLIIETAIIGLQAAEQIALLAICGAAAVAMLWSGVRAGGWPMLAAWLRPGAPRRQRSAR